MTNLEYQYIIQTLRNYFINLEYVEVETQSKLSVLSACESPDSITPFLWRGITYPMIQTGQMRLEKELLANPDHKGVFCQTTSYRQEPNPIAGRHEDVFSMFEFEGRGTIADLWNIEEDLMNLFMFPKQSYLTYKDAKIITNSNDIGAAEEEYLWKNYSPTIFLMEFPTESNPFFNMKQNANHTYAKTDVILYGYETIGSAERETDVNKMYHQFNTISDGEYANKLFSLFGKDRVIKELEEFLALPMVPRFGGGLGLGRLARALRLKSI
mgnify:CR=1 FL=1